MAPVVRLAEAIGWHVSVLDARRRGDLSGRFPEADRAEGGDARSLVGRPEIGPTTPAVVRHHEYPADRAAIGALILAGVFSIGVLGPRRRTDRMLLDLAASGIRPADPAVVRGPVGLDLGGPTPAEIALAIVAEVQAVAHGRGGGPLGEAASATRSGVTAATVAAGGLGRQISLDRPAQDRTMSRPTGPDPAGDCIDSNWSLLSASPPGFGGLLD